MAAPALPYVELHCASAYSLRRAGSGVEALVARAAALGMPALALTDYMTLAGMVQFQAHCVRHGIRAVAGAELAVADPVFGATAQPAQIVALAENATGYARLCQLLTDANLAQPEAPVIPFSALAQQPAGLIVLTGGMEGTLARLLLARRRQEAEAVARRYRDAFGPAHVYVELQDHGLPESIELLRQLVEVAEVAGLGVVVTNRVRHATREDYALYDLLTCVRLGITMDAAHRERPRNDEAFLRGADEMVARFAPRPWGREALAASAAIAARCDLSLLKGTCTAPRVPLPAGQTPTTQLQALCAVGLAARFAALPAAQEAGSPQRCQLEHELAVIQQLDLEEFFLCVHDIVRQARQSGIRVSGRGSAANSLVAYLLGITGVDPLQHKLLFERFLNPDRRGMPDIDLDVQSDRRDELIRYVEQIYTPEHAAMVANVITYRPRSALRDAAKALGFPLPLVNRLTKVLPHHSDHTQLPGYAAELRQVVATLLPGGDGATGTSDPAGEGGTTESAAAEACATGVTHPAHTALRTRCLARLPLALNLAVRLCGLPRHLSLHNGGLVLSREPLTAVLPIRISANGVRALEINKDDVEAMGLIKFDLLGLRTLSAVEEALALIEETTGTRPDVDHLPTDPPDPATMRLIRAGQTLAVFQIESPGQWHLLAETQPQTFDDLIVQTALFRPGPIQGGFVRPYVARRRADQAARQTAEPQARPEPVATRAPNPQRPPPTRRQRDAVQTPWQGAPADDFWTGHPVLGPILRDTTGILLFQEQILQVAHAFAGLSYAEADGFRRAMSHARTHDEMEAMRARFVAGALARGERGEDALRVFGAMSAFVGYGFCRSHAAEFARTIYVTAWLKAHYPAHYLAAFLSAQPAGFFPPHVVLEEAKLLGVPVLPVDLNRSEDRFSVERVGTPPGRWAIRIGLAQVAQVGEELARAILWERQRGRHDGREGTGHTEQRGRWDRPGASLVPERPFASLGDFCQRLRPAGLTWPAAEALVLAGACDGLAPRLERRRRLWHLHELWPLVAGPKRTRQGAGRRARGNVAVEEPVEQLALEWVLEPEDPAAIPPLPALDAEARSALDYQLLGLSARPHPLRLTRRALRRQGIRTIAELAEVPAGQVVRVAGWPISAQRPPTAHGMGFVVLEDETGRLPIALPPRLAAELHRIIRDARVVLVAGRVEQVRWYRSVLGFILEGVG